MLCVYVCIFSSDLDILMCLSEVALLMYSVFCDIQNMCVQLYIHKKLSIGFDTAEMINIFGFCFFGFVGIA